MRKGILSLAILAGFSGAVGCGGSSDSSETSVDSVTLQQSIIPAGGATVVETDFSFDAGNVFNEDGRVVLQFLLPPGVAYRGGSAELDTIGGNDIRVDDFSRFCPSGETLVTFDVDSDRLLGALNPGGNADGTLTFTVDGASPTQALIQARGDDSPDSSECGQPFIAEATASITVQ